MKHTIAPQTQRVIPASDPDLPKAGATQIMRMPEANFIQRKCSHCEEEEKEKVRLKPLAPFIQKKAEHGNSVVSNTVSDGIAATRGSGTTMVADTQSFMENRFGEDFSDVRIHTGSDAAQLSGDLQAQAFTVGKDIYFNNGKYAPESDSGKHLLAHELTHTIQQGGEGKMVQRKATATRFMEDPVLDDISEGKKVLKEKDKGPAVIKITQAISELGFYPTTVIDESFDPPLTTGITNYQVSKGIAGSAIAGQMDKPTFLKLDKDFSNNFQVEKDVLSKQKKADLLKGTDAIDDEERKEINKVISTEVPVNPITGLKPEFKPNLVGKGKYADRLLSTVEAAIISEYNTYGKGKSAAHADASKLYAPPQIDVIAKESQKAVDNIFHEYEKGAPAALKVGSTVFDAWTFKEQELTAGGKAKEDRSAIWRINKILTGDDDVKTLNREHGAIESRADELLIVNKVRKDMFAKYRTELIETHKGWPGFEDNNKVYVQMFKSDKQKRNRHNMWDYYQTFIHEYIHSLEDPVHIAYRSAKDDEKGGFVLREGVTDYFTKIVWNSITITDALRKTIEGPYYDPVNKFSIQALNTYGESENAERLAGVVGIRNLAAAFFAGKVELIGKK
ncbi:uncharacterized protein DUF4157 [Chitinophaga niastensis]|uniref:Uncharacterized protein DUF4157 n=1 Tax=Chitinophaga niastensis TaxID=536980 RepID=A0A2P8HEZ5_CHINA|nr:DUF4157 domain-containing protein [Chitinophaga niastensis]PSL44802.1 uncharacterized protein DUF4157 [Chitinophaga niastensis]